ncbi:MAG: hypothetical protein QOE66_2396, partial [Chloroflexota bacterium]|nr:hypothetical protein [Chloroflexota bacterium]
PTPPILIVRARYHAESWANSKER